MFYSEWVLEERIYGGNTETLLNSIREKLFTLPDDVIVYPGHGEPTTIGYEKENNPFLAG
jgi:glyoxylase-like metal-dependent hydrolase (beta-lactamase superfamily II)